MTKPPFQIWARTEIARFRDQADALQRALDLYQGDENPSQNSFQANGNSVPWKQPRTSKYESLFRRFEQAGRPLTMDEMMSLASAEGFALDRSNLRSQVFAQKTAGRAHAEGRGYRWGRLDSEPAPPLGEAPVS